MNDHFYQSAITLAQIGLLSAIAITICISSSQLANRGSPFMFY